MPTRRRAPLGVAASIGAIGAAGGLATVASAAPEPITQVIADPLSETLDALRAENEQLQAKLEAEQALTAGLGRVNVNRLSHELHSLASAMQTAAEALELGAAEANPALAERLIGGLLGHTRRLSRLADDLQELALSD